MIIKESCVIDDDLSYRDFEDEVYNILSDEIIKRTPHGEYGEDIYGEFHYRGKKYEGYLEHSWGKSDGEGESYWIDGVHKFIVRKID